MTEISSFGLCLFRVSLRNDKNLTKLLPRENIINRIHESIYKQNLIFVLGNEGVGKSWVAARNWLTMMKKPLHLFLSAQKLGDLDINDLESFLIKKIIEQTNETSNDLSIKKWKDRFEKCGNLSDQGNIDLLITIDGINQKPNINWSEVINNLTYFFKNKNVKILVTSRTIFFNEIVKRKISDEYEVVTVSDWTAEERDEILIEKKINPKSLSASVAQSLLNPRLLNIALSLFDTKEIQTIDELDVNRILLEHIRRMESDNYENITYTDFLKNLQTHAKEIIDRLEDEDDDLNYFNGQLDAVAEGHFFEVIADDLNAYKLKDEGLSFALGLEIVLQLNKMKRNGKNLDDGLAKVIDPINALDKTSDIIISSLTILIFESNYYSKEVLTALVKCFVSLQNTDDSYLNYFTTIVEKKISDFINILEELCLDGGHQPNFDWTKNSIIYV